MFNTGLIPGGTRLTYTDNASDSSDLSTYTFSAQSVGIAASNRYIIVGITWYDAASAPAAGTVPTSVTIGGVTATAIVENSAKNGTVTVGAGLYRAALPTGTTADVVVVHGGTRSGCACGTYSLFHSTGTPTSTSSSAVESTTASTSSLTTPTKGVAVAAMRDTDNVSADIIWSGSASPTENYSRDGISNADAGATFTSDGVVTVTEANAEIVCLMAATW